MLRMKNQESIEKSIFCSSVSCIDKTSRLQECVGISKACNLLYRGKMLDRVLSTFNCYINCYIERKNCCRSRLQECYIERGWNRGPVGSRRSRRSKKTFPSDSRGRKLSAKRMLYRGKMWVLSTINCYIERKLHVDYLITIKLVEAVKLFKNWLKLFEVCTTSIWVSHYITGDIILKKKFNKSPKTSQKILFINHRVSDNTT